MRGRKPGDGDLGNVYPMPGMTGAAQPDPVPDPPGYLDWRACKLWRELAPRLAEQGRLKPHYLLAFENLVTLWSLRIAVESEVVNLPREEGQISDVEAPLYWIAETRNGVQMKSHKSIADVQTIIAKMNPLLTMFGMSPLDDARVKDPRQGNLFEELNAMLSKPHNAPA